MFDSESMAAHADRIRASGILGRASRLQRLFDFLVDCSVSGRVPKEMDIALEALGRGATFDVTQDAVVRVYVHKLRRRLDDFYQDAGAQLQNRIVVAKGEYRLALQPQQPDAHPAAVALPSAAPASWSRRFIWLAGALAISLLANLMLFIWPRHSGPVNAVAQQIRANPVWSQIVSDDLPVVLVVGDYYIFGETDESMEVKRMVREFAVNSRRDLEQFAASHPETADRYMDLDLTYLPTSVG